jgi:hypothetical protein
MFGELPVRQGLELSGIQACHSTKSISIMGVWTMAISLPLIAWEENSRPSLESCAEVYLGRESQGLAVADCEEGITDGGVSVLFIVRQEIIEITRMKTREASGELLTG